MQSRVLKTVGLLMVALFCGHSVLAADIKLATVDMQKALQSVEAGKKARANLEKEYNERKKNFQAEEAALTKMRDDLKKQSLVLSDEARKKKEAEFQEKFVKYQQEAQSAQVELQKKEMEYTKPIIEKLRGVVSDLGKKKGYTMILEKNENGVLYSQSNDDLTDEVIKEFNGHHG